jgi:hypothetical protein
MSASKRPRCDTPHHAARTDLRGDFVRAEARARGECHEWRDYTCEESPPRSVREGRGPLTTSSLDVRTSLVLTPRLSQSTLAGLPRRSVGEGGPFLVVRARSDSSVDSEAAREGCRIERSPRRRHAPDFLEPVLHEDDLASTPGAGTAQHHEVAVRKHVVFRTPIGAPTILVPTRRYETHHA